MNNTCPNCGTVYNITLQHVGRQFSCKKCGARLVVETDGFHLASPGKAGGPEPESYMGESFAAGPPPLRRSAALPGGVANIQTRLRGIADLPTWFFGAGAFLVILFLFFPLIDQAKVSRRQGLITEGDHREQRRDKEFNEKRNKNEPVDEEARQKARDAWKKERERLQEDVEDAQVALQRAPYWYRWGMMLGFLLLAGASLAYLNPDQPLIRRITGCIVILTEVVLIFIIFATRSGFGL